MNYLLTVFLIGFVIFFHELGHFIAAKYAKIPIKIFSIGFGPKLWSVTKGITEYRISLIPIGGYVLPDIEDEREFFDLPVMSRLIMSAGGPLASFLLPTICFSVLLTYNYGFSVAYLIIQPIQQVYMIAMNMLTSIPKLFSHTGQLSGVVGIVAQGSSFIKNDLTRTIQFIALLSLNLGVLNLMPIPVLDGGKMILYLLEKIHPKFLRLHYPLVVVGWVFVLGLMIYVTALDITRILIV
ncbi:MAG: site-2 protease family protein [Bacillota bacterium]